MWAVMPRPWGHWHEIAIAPQSNALAKVRADRFEIVRQIDRSIAIHVSQATDGRRNVSEAGADAKLVVNRLADIAVAVRAGAERDAVERHVE